MKGKRNGGMKWVLRLRASSFSGGENWHLSLITLFLQLRETAGKLADFTSYVHRTGKIPPRNDLDWARSNFHLFAENMSALQSECMLCKTSRKFSLTYWLTIFEVVSDVLHGEGPRFPDAGLNTLKMANSSRYGKRLLSQSPSLEGGSSKPLSTPFPPLNRHVSYDKVIIPGMCFFEEKLLFNITLTSLSFLKQIDQCGLPILSLLWREIVLICHTIERLLQLMIIGIYKDLKMVQRDWIQSITGGGNVVLNQTGQKRQDD